MTCLAIVLDSLNYAKCCFHLGGLERKTSQKAVDYSHDVHITIVPIVCLPRPVIFFYSQTSQLCMDDAFYSLPIADKAPSSTHKAKQ